MNQALDTLAASRKLQHVGMQGAHAEAVVEVVNDAMKNLVTKDQLKAELDQSFHAFERKLDAKLEKRFTKIDDRFEAMDAKFEAKFDEVNKKLDKAIADGDNKLDKAIAESDNKLDKAIAESDNKLDKAIAESDNKLDKAIAESDKKLEKAIAESNKKLEKAIAESDKKLEKAIAESDKKFEQSNEKMAAIFDASISRLESKMNWRLVIWMLGFGGPECEYCRHGSRHASNLPLSQAHRKTPIQPRVFHSPHRGGVKTASAVLVGGQPRRLHPNYFRRFLGLSRILSYTFLARRETAPFTEACGTRKEAK